MRAFGDLARAQFSVIVDRYRLCANSSERRVTAMDLAIMIHSIQCIAHHSRCRALIRPGVTVCGHACTSSKFIKAIYFHDGICNRSKRPASEITDLTIVSSGFVMPRNLDLYLHATAKSRPLWPPFTFSSPATTSSLPSPTTVALTKLVNPELRDCSNFPSRE